MPLRVAVLGAGMMGRFHASAAQRNGAVVVAVADADLDRARSLGDAVGRSAKPMLPAGLFDTHGLDAVHICTPPEAHADDTRRFLARGANVICEKPVGRTAPETQALVQLAALHSVILCPVHQFPFQEGVMTLRDSGEAIGRVRHLTGEICTAGADAASDTERHQLAIDVLPHPLSLFRAFGAQNLAAVDWKITSVAPGEFVFSGVAGTQTGLSFLISTRGRPTSNTMRVIGERGTGTIDMFHGFSILERGEVSRLRKASRPFTHSALTVQRATANGVRRALRRESGFPGLRELVARFYGAIANGTPPPVSGEEMLDIAIARDGIISSLG